ncbi:SPFH domain-containing protein [uncultured Selenomonas sp.]|jgi:hypothetical protein|uniref:SPFH domain-containing protein n=1 Tax=uncultured Selenomonas sp. TaxID=159275 RepID=UPI001CB0F56C|nr:SPFH domain-containing protein [uncultured Selenomonas sp.]MBF1688141.1 SPFH domain-containing protein [Selenomonas sp.]
MGLIQAAAGAVGGVLADQWKEFYCCDSLDADTLVAKGEKRTSARGRSSNTSGESNIITTGSVVVVNVGQCMMIVDQGKVVEICAEPGAYTYDASTEPTVFGGDLASDLKAVLRNIGRRFTFGGDPAKDQRIYYVNTKEIIGNKYGTAQSIQFETVLGAYTLNVNIRCFGTYSYRIANPILFYTNVCGNVDGDYMRSEIDEQLRSELLTALQPAFGRIAAQGIRYSQLINYTKEIRDALAVELSAEWGEKRGIEIVSFGVSSVKADERDEQRIKDLQDGAIMSDANLRAGRIAGAAADAIRTAASNENGVASSFMGLGMVGNLSMGAMGTFGPQGNAGGAVNPFPAQTQQGQSTEGWTCACGHTGNTGKFCAECGKPRPIPAGWTCTCGAVNQGNFCTECGKPRPAGAPLYRCDKCGWTPDDPTHPPKFCPQCGDAFDEKDKQ